jgi:probable F420-dependent oxidoreductase
MPSSSSTVRSVPHVPDVRWGLTIPFAGVPLRDHRPLLELAEAEGFEDLWTGEATGVDGFTPLALATAWTKRARLATGIVNPFTRGIPVLAQHAAALQDASEGRFVLGLGSSSNVIVERWNGIPFEKPLSRMRDAVEALRPILAGERAASGFRLEQAPQPPPPIMLAALRGKMLALAAELADGAFTNFLPLSGARKVAEAFGVSQKELVCRFFCIPQPEDDALPLARRMFAAYGTVPVYSQFFRWLGWSEKIDPMAEAWNAGDRARALELVPDDLVRDIFVFGGPDEQHERLAAFAEAGITTFVLTAITGPDDLPATIRALARR